jgi:hypothetical protein
MGIRTGTYLEALRSLHRQIEHEISCAVRRDEDTTALRSLRTKTLDAIDREEQPASRASRPRLDLVGQRLAQLGVTSHEVKVWAFGQGLVDAVKRGRISAALVQAYAAATEAQRALDHQHGVGTCPACNDRMLRPDVWHNATPDQRNEWKRWGFARQGGRGYCTKCYVRLKNHGELDQRQTRTSPGDDICSRCGLTDIATNGDRLCPDCAEFVANDDHLGASA